MARWTRGLEAEWDRFPHQGGLDRQCRVPGLTPPGVMANSPIRMQHALRLADPRPVICARVAGAGYLVIIVAGIFAEFFVRSGIRVPGDPGATARNLATSEGLFRAGIAGDLVMLLADVVVALALYLLLREVSRGLALLATFFRLAHAAVYGATLLTLWVPLVLLGGAPYLAVVSAPEREALAQLLLESHGYGYALGLVFFGAHCLVLGYLVLRSGIVPRLLGGLLLVAGVGYLVDSFARTLLVDYAQVQPVLDMVVFVPAFVAELSFCLWLLLKGVRPLHPVAD